mmetsp:Transcript_64644/g.154320  ORF Transcript_64644/g.154320 Transcript_64644/m.154320 type:complete len:676 (+) Transcript_64644:146-2173(+)
MGPFKSINRVVHKAADRIMMAIVGNDHTYIYNVSWEDPRIDHTVLKCDASDHVITIASAGCNTFDYLIEGARVTAVDFNGAQIALTELKSVACQNLEWEQFFAIFAKNDMNLLRTKYYGGLRNQLTEPSKRFWDKQIKSIKSMMYSGTSGMLAYFVCRILFRVLGLGFIRRTLCEQQSLDAFHSECRNHKRQLTAFCYIIDKLISNAGFALLAGVPSRQLELGLHRNDNFETVFKRICSTDMVLDNYFYYGYIAGEYTESCCPQYLKKEHYATLKKALAAGRLSLFEGTLVDVCKQRPEQVFTVASLLDHMDWMPPFMVNEEFHWLQKRMCPIKGRCFWRSFSEGVHSAPLVWLKPTKVEDTGDRVAMYWSTWMAPLNKDTVRFQLQNRSWGTPVAEQSFLGSLATGAKIVAFPVLQSLLQWRVKSNTGISGHASKMEAFYESQKHEYDAFRESFLHARSTLIDCVPIKNFKQVWIDVGGGTGRNLEFLSAATIRDHFSKIYIVDVSPSLLEIAKERVEKAGLKDIVECVFCDFTSDQAVKDKLPAAGSVDLVTFSYSLSMIPDKTSALKQAASLLKPKGEGVLGLADFWFGGGQKASLGKGDADGITNLLTRLYCHATRLWFKQDGVILLKQSMLDPVRDRFDFDAVPTENFRKRVPLLPLLRPWHGVQMAPTK